LPAFSLGEIGSSASEQNLPNGLRSGNDLDVVSRLLEALGKSGSNHVYDDVVAFGFPVR